MTNSPEKVITQSTMNSVTNQHVKIASTTKFSY